MIGLNCTFSFTHEVEGNKQEVNGARGIIRSEIMQKHVKDKTYSVIWVQHAESGQLHEVFAHKVSVVNA